MVWKPIDTDSEYEVSDISEVCQGKRKTTGGFKWEYFESSTTNSSDKCCEMGDFTISE